MPGSHSNVREGDDGPLGSHAVDIHVRQEHGSHVVIPPTSNKAKEDQSPKGEVF